MNCDMFQRRYTQPFDKVKTLMMILILGFLSCGAFAAEFPKVIATEGKHAIADAGLEIDAVSTNGTVKYSVSVQYDFGSKAVGPSKPVSVSEGWLFYVESQDRVWFFDGANSLVLWQFGYKGGGSYDSDRTKWLKNQVPSRLAKMLSDEIRKRLLD